MFQFQCFCIYCIFINIVIIPGTFKVWLANVVPVVSRKYAPPPPFATLALVQNAGRAYTRDVTIFSHDYALPSGHEAIVSGGWGPSMGRRQARGGEMLPMLAVG